MAKEQLIEIIKPGGSTNGYSNNTSSPTKMLGLLIFKAKKLLKLKFEQKIDTLKKLKKKQSLKISRTKKLLRNLKSIIAPKVTKVKSTKVLLKPQTASTLAKS